MRRQSLIENYYKIKASPSNFNKTMDVRVDKKRNLSLQRSTTPIKSPKMNDENTNVTDVTNLCSDDEDIWDITPKVRTPCEDLTQCSNDSEEASSECSASTVQYSPAKCTQSPKSKTNFTCKTKSSLLTTPKKGNKYTENQKKLKQNVQIPIKTEPCIETPQKSMFQTPKKSPHSGISLNSSQGSSLKSPRSSEKFFSPVRKRNVVKRPSNKVVRSLSSEMTRSITSRLLFEDDLFSNACEGVDDKTIFLLQIINECLNMPPLKQLLDSESQALLTNCLQVVKPGMRVVCRLYWLKDKWYKKEQVTQICSESTKPLDDNNFNNMISSLLENGLLVQSGMQNMTFDHFITILKKDDLKNICKELKINVNSKQNAVESLRSFSKKTSNISNFLIGNTISNHRKVLQMMSAKAGVCYKLSDLARSTLYKLYLIMYLGMDYDIIREKKLELTLIYDKIKRETYPIDKKMALDNASIVFKTKDDFERYLEAHLLYEEYVGITDLEAKCEIVKQAYRLYQEMSGEEMERCTSLPKWLHRYTPASIYVKILESGVQELKKNKQESNYALALSILDSLIGQNTFRQHRKAEWYAEKALILHSCGKYDEAAEVLLEGFRSGLPEEVMDSMRPRAKKIATQKNISLSEQLRADLLQHATKEEILEKNFGSKHIDKLPMERSGPRGKVKFETRTAEGRMVQEAEEYCIMHYICSNEFTHGEHWEGRIVSTLFFLLFWDIIYGSPAGARGVFLSRFQRVPLDLFTDSFYTNRRGAIDRWLGVIAASTEDKLLQIMKDTWDSRPEYELSGFQRGSMSWDQVKAVAGCLQPRGLAAVCRRLATNYHYTHSGFPDLTLWHEHTRQIKFVEVKTDSDKPSMKQLQWMQYLSSHSLPAEFCYVGRHTGRQRARAHRPAPSDNKPRVNKPKVKSEKRPKAKKSPKVKPETEQSPKVKLENEQSPKVKLESGTETEIVTIEID